MRARVRSFIASLIVLTASLALPGVSQAQMTAEVSGGMGVTLVDLGQWSRLFVPSRDWGTTAVQLRGLVLPLSVGKLSIGGEFATQSLFWYTYNSCPGCSSFQPGTTWVSSTSFMAIGRFDAGRRTFVDVGGGVFLVDGDTRVGASVAVGYSIPVNERIFVPVKVRTDLVFGEFVVPAVSAGLSVKF